VILEDYLDEYVRRRKSDREPDGMWHASGLFGCDRQAVYGKLGVEKTSPNSDRSMRTLWLGSHLHEVVQEALTEYVESIPDAKVYIEVPCRMPDLEYKSTCDALLYTPDDGYVLVEFKTIGAYGWKKELPQESHVGQARSYAMALRRVGHPDSGILPLGDKLRRGVIVYINKDNLEQRLCWFDVDIDVENQIERRILDLTVLANHRMLPERLPFERGKRAWLCGYCDHATRCWDTDPDEGEFDGGL
jgi:hypothetical protein